MPGRTDDDQRDDLFEEDEESDENESEEDESDDQSNESDKDAQGDVNKRIRDLQSAADKATARANKAEEALKALKRGDGTADGSNDPAQKALLLELRESALDAVFASQPLLKEYGIDRDIIEGSTRAEVRESAAALVGLIKSLETKVRNKTLAEHGLKAETSGSARKPLPNFETMSDEDFEKVLNSV